MARQNTWQHLPKKQICVEKLAQQTAAGIGAQTRRESLKLLQEDRHILCTSRLSQTIDLNAFARPRCRRRRGGGEFFPRAGKHRHAHMEMCKQ